MPRMPNVLTSAVKVSWHRPSRERPDRRIRFGEDVVLSVETAVLLRQGECEIAKNVRRPLLFRVRHCVGQREQLQEQRAFLR